MDLQRLQFSRRPACNRCRDQKLRCCWPDDQTSDACTRCQRAHFPCITGARRRVGRPRASASASPPYPRSNSQRVTNAMPDTSQQTTQLLEDLSTATPVSSGAFTLGEDDFSYNPGSLEFLDFDFSSSNSPLSPTFNTSQNLDLPAPTSLADKMQINNMNPRELGGSVSIKDLEPSRHSALGGVPDNNTNIIRQPLGLIESGSSNMLQRLARLNVDASSLISCLELLKWSGPEVLDSCGETLKKPELDPLSQILNITAELGSILEEVIPLHSAPKTAGSLTMPIALLCVSCYLQLLHIFDYTFGRVCELLSGVSDIDQFFALAPKFHLHQGLPPVKGRFYLKIIIQTIKHHLGNVEQLLRLPPGTTVSGRSLPRYEFCDNEGILKIFHIAMEQSRETPKKTTSVIVESIKASIEYLSSFTAE